MLTLQGVLGLVVKTHNHNAAMHVNPPLLPSHALHRAETWWKTRKLPIYASQQESDLEKYPHTLRIPHIIHQSWTTRDLEPLQKELQKTWLDNHPTWTYMFWTDKDNRDLIADKFLWFLSIYDNLPSPVQRADCARYFYMLQYGGCYFDLDFESLKPLEPLFQDVQVALGYMTQETSHMLSIPNAFLASVPGHQFWLYVIKHVLRNYDSNQVDTADVFRVTGPYMLKEAIEDFQATSILKDLTFFPSGLVYGSDWNWQHNASMQNVFDTCQSANPAFDASKCKTFFPDAYSITYWSGDITRGH